MPTPSTLIIYIPYIIKAPYFLLYHSWDIFTMSLISQNVLILLYMKPSLPHSFKTPWTIFSLALPSFLRDLLFPSLFYLLTNPCAFPIHLAKIWQWINVLWYLVTLPGRQEEERNPMSPALGSRKPLSYCLLLPPATVLGNFSHCPKIQSLQNRSLVDSLRCSLLCGLACLSLIMMWNSWS